MKYPILSLLVGLISITFVNAQDLKWIASGAGDANYTTNNNAFAVESTEDYVFISGYADGNIVYIKDTTITHGDFSFLAQFDKEGNLRWVHENAGEEVNDLAVNSKGEVYTIYTTWDFKNHILKFDKNGIQLWDKQFTQFDVIKAITVDKDDNLFVTGNYFTSSDSLVVEDTVIHNLYTGRINCFVMKYDSEGQFKWFNTSKNTVDWGYIYLNDVQSNGNGETYVTGFYELLNEDDSIQFGDFFLNSESDPTYPLIYFNNTDIVLAKLSTNGEVLWAKGYGGYKNDWGNKIEINASSDVFMTGTYSDTVYFSNFKSALIGSHVFVCKVNPEGDVEWANQIASNLINNENEQGKALAVDDDYVYVGGTYIGNYAVYGSTNLEDSLLVFGDSKHRGFLARYSPDGDFIDINHILSDQAGIEDISLDGETIYVAGNALPPATFFNKTIPVVSNNNNNHFFIASLVQNPLTGYPVFKVSNISYHPNPATSYFVIQADNKEKIINLSVIDLKGNILIIDRNPGNYCRVDISSLPAGLYVLKIQTTDGFEVKKLVKGHP